VFVVPINVLVPPSFCGGQNMCRVHA
jgi:hypothetical protein